MKAFWIALFPFAVLVLMLLWFCRIQGGGQFFYPIDDAYIGMSVAKHLVQSGIWGTSPEFGSCVSNPGFIVLLALCYWITGIHIWWPLVLAAGAAVLAIYAAYRLLEFTPEPTRIAGCVGVALLAPLHIMAIIGMEHSLQIALTLFFLGSAISVLVKNAAVRFPMLSLAAAMVAVRYEGLFVVAPVCLILLLRRRWPEAVQLGAAAWLPVLLFGLYFRMHGGTWLPNSLLLKGGANYGKLVYTLRFLAFYFLPILAALTWAALRRRLSPPTPASAVLYITAVAAWLHLFLASFGWVYRYEAYLLSMAIVALLLLSAEGPFGRGFNWLVRVGVMSLVLHATWATYTIPGRSSVTYGQHYQTAKFARLIKAPMAVNDIGAVTFFADQPILDLTGLSSQEVMNARFRNAYTTGWMRELLRKHHVEAVAVYESWFHQPLKFPWCGPPLPAEYIRIAHLDTPNGYGYADEPRVTYYAAPGAEARVREALEQLKTSVPAGDSLEFESNEVKQSASAL